MYDLIFKSRALRSIKKINKEFQKEIISEFENLKINPFPTGYRKLVGVSNKLLETLNCKELYRIRCNMYRIVYSVNESNVTVCVVEVAPRKEVYNFLKSK